ncbi:MAG: cation:proton antiporter, partial [Demequinaceae bacterium]|nr:cation:proton antiporter [Demequinaceae bacterium]
MTEASDAVGSAAVNVGDILIGLGIVLLVLAMLGRLAARLGVPSVPLYLIGGLFLGQGGPFPVHAGDEFLSVGAEIGIVLLLLLLGLEYSPQDLRDGMRSTWLAGLVDGLLNGLPGFAAGLILGWNWTASILLAGVTYISSSGIIARLIHDLGRIANRETPIILSLLVMEDIVMAVFLPIVAVLVIGASLTQGILAIAVALSVVAAAFAIAFRLGDRVSRAIHSRSSELLILTILGITFLVAGIADAVQVSAAVGAFLLGVTLSGRVADDVRTLLPPFRDVFGGFFFVFFGMRVELATLPPVLLPALALAAIGIVTKLATGRFAAARAGLGKKAQRRTAYALVPRGEF